MTHQKYLFNTEEGSQRGTEEQNIYKTNRKQNSIYKSECIKNYIKCAWIKHFQPKGNHQHGLKKASSNYTLSSRNLDSMTQIDWKRMVKTYILCKVIANTNINIRKNRI